MLIGLILGQQKKMEDSRQLILENLIKLTRSSENKFKRGNFKGALDDKINANAILKSKSCDEKMIQEYRKELSSLYCSKFDLIFDHKLQIMLKKLGEILKVLKFYQGLYIYQELISFKKQ